MTRWRNKWRGREGRRAREKGVRVRVRVSVSESEIGKIKGGKEGGWGKIKFYVTIRKHICV